MCAVFVIVPICSAVSGSPPPIPPRIPAGLIVTVVAVEDLTSSIFVLTLALATSIATISPMLIASMMIIAPDLTGLRRAFRIPRVTTFIHFLLLFSDVCL